MYLIFFIFLLILLFVYLLFKETASADFIFDTDNNKLNLRLKWLYPLIQVEVEIHDYSPHINFYIFKKRVYTKTTKPKGNKKFPVLDYFRSLYLTDTFIKIYYSLNDPYRAGLSFAIIQIIQFYINNVSIIQYPNFISDHAYITIQSGTKINLGKTAVKLLHIKINKYKNKRRKEYGTVQYG